MPTFFDVISGRMAHLKRFHSIEFGDISNYVKVGKTGILLKGNARHKRRIRIPTTATGKAVAAPTTVYAGNFVGYQFALNDEIYYTSEIVQRWDGATNIEVLLNWCVNEVYATNNGEVQWQIDWSAVPGDGTENINSPTHSGTLVTGDINIGTVLYGNFKTSLSTDLPAVNLNQQDLLGLRLKRIAIDDGSNPGVNPVILQVEMIITVDKLGQSII